MMCLGVPGRVIEIYEKDRLRMGRVDFGGVIKEACLEYVPEVKVGDYTLIHVGFAISQIDEEEARKTLDMLAEMEMLAGDLPKTESTP
jgi:hydrogenase expression/formation protein HypC